MSDQPRDIRDFEYLADFITGKWWKPSLPDDEEEDEENLLEKEESPRMNQKVLLIAGGAVVFSIVYIILMCLFLPGPELPYKQTKISNLIIFSLNTNRFVKNESDGQRDIIQRKRDDNRDDNDQLLKVITPIKSSLSLSQSIRMIKGKTLSSTDKTLSENVNIIEGVLNKTRDEIHKIEFAFEYNDENGNFTIKKYNNPSSARQALDDILNITNKTANDPNQTEALLLYNRTLAHDASIVQQSYTLFGAEPADYSSHDAFMNDTKRALKVISELMKSKLKILFVTNSAEVIEMIDKDYNDNDTQICTIDRTQLSPQQTVSVIFNLTTAETSTCSMIVPTTTTASSKPSTGLSSTPSPTIAPSEPITGSSSTPSPPPHPFVSPPCYGYFVFIVDASNGTKHCAEELQAVDSITKLWNLNGTGKLEVTVVATGLTDGIHGKEFSGNRTGWESALAQLSTDLFFPPKGLPMSPENISKAIASSYCNKSSEYRMAANGNVTFVIFTSYNDESGISAALSAASKPWLVCPTAERESIFMAAIDGGSATLAKLSFPDSDSFMKITQFDDSEIVNLTNRIVLTMCDCKRTADGHLPKGCTPITYIPTTAPPTTTTNPPPPTTTTSSTTKTVATTTSHPVSSPSCVGKFVFVLDASKKAKHLQEELRAIDHITESWNLDGITALNVSAAATGVTSRNGLIYEPFTSMRDKWKKHEERLSDKITNLNRTDLPMPPTNISSLLLQIYGEGYHIHRDLNFIIFTSYSDFSGEEFTAQPWINCTRNESIFMVAIDGGSQELNNLSYPSRDLFMRMTDFSVTEVDDLTKKIVLKMCDCKPKSGGNKPQGCPEVSAPKASYLRIPSELHPAQNPE